MDTITKGGGLFYQGIGGQAVTAYSLIYMGADGRWYLADADAAATLPTLGLAPETLSTGRLGRVLFKGIVQNRGWAWTIGGEIYASGTAGVLTQTPPVITQQVAIAIASDTIFFDPKGETWGVASGCPVLEGATAYVGSDPCMSPYTNYFYTGDYGTHTLLLAAVVDYVATLGGGSISLEAMTFDGRLIVDEDEVEVFGQGWDTIINEVTETGNAIYVTGDRCVIRDLQCGTTPGGGNLYNGIESTGDDLLVNNVFVNGSDDVGILIGGPRNKVTNCYIYNTDFQGIVLAALGDTSVISNNLISTTANDGITINADAENCVVEGNYITGWTGEAIDDDSGTASIGHDNWAGAGSYEIQTGIIAVPTVVAGGAWIGRVIEVYNSDEERYFSCVYQDSDFRGVEYL